jgi:RNA polymerase sigma-70 factor (ECF subfamily)
LSVGTVLETSQLTDEQLAATAAREDSDGPAFVALVHRYQDRVWRICWRLLGNADDASDAAQEVFVRLFLNRAGFRGASKYSTWVHGIALRTCLSMRRGRGRRERRETAAGEAAARRQLDQPRQAPAELAMDLMAMLDALDEEDRAMLILKYAEGHTHEGLAEMFGLSVSACKMRLSRAREKLKEKYPDRNL